jgi:hypothetical protein
VKFPRRLFRFLIQEPLVLCNNVFPEIGHSHLPAHHSLKISVELLGLPEIHHIVYGLCGKVVFDPFLPVVFSLNFCFLVAGFKLCVPLEETGECAANLGCDLCQIVARFLQVLVDGNAPLYAFIGSFTKCECRDWINLLPLNGTPLR